MFYIIFIIYYIYILYSFKIPHLTLLTSRRLMTIKLLRIRDLSVDSCSWPNCNGTHNGYNTTKQGSSARYGFWLKWCPQRTEEFNFVKHIDIFTLHILLIQSQTHPLPWGWTGWSVVGMWRWWQLLWRWRRSRRLRQMWACERNKKQQQAKHNFTC